MFVSDRSIASLAAFASAAIFLFAATLLGIEPSRADPVRGDDYQARFNDPALAPIGPRELPQIHARIEPGDDIAALEAVDIALTQASDGATYVWRRGGGRIVGAVRPTNTFRDADRRICRHIEMQIRLGSYNRRTEGIACRGADGVWELEG